jgi:hypothetical protein
MLGKFLCGLGDINNDGFDDVAFSSDQPPGTYIFYGGDPADDIPDYFLRGGGLMAAGTDMNGDGTSDLVVQYNWDRILLYRGFGDSIESEPSDSIGPGTTSYSFGRSVQTGLFSDDAIGDLVLIEATPGGGTIRYYENPFSGNTDPAWDFANTGYAHMVSTVGFVDFDGDGFVDVFANHQADLDSLSSVHIFKGPNLHDQPDIVIGDPIELDTLGYPNGR